MNVHLEFLFQYLVNSYFTLVEGGRQVIQFLPVGQVSPSIYVKVRTLENFIYSRLKSYTLSVPETECFSVAIN